MIYVLSTMLESYGGVFYLLILTVLWHGAFSSSVNNKPVVGVVAQAIHGHLQRYGQEYISADYVKYLEMAGASVVAVKGSQSRDYYVELFKRVNGILLPGGSADVMKSPYARSSGILYDLAKHANDKGDYFPVWGTCLGFEMLSVLTAGENVLLPTDSENISLPLHLLPNYKASRLFENIPEDILHYLTTEDITANFHHQCLKMETYKENKFLNKLYRLLSVNTGRQGVKYVSTMEAIHYPFYGVQWHPEKNIFNRRSNQDISHTAHAVKIAQYFADFFVNEARKNMHKFESQKERYMSMIENDFRVFIPETYVEYYFYNVTET